MEAPVDGAIRPRAARLSAPGALVLALCPGVASACAVCLDGAGVSGGFNAAFAGLLLVPFAVVGAIAGAIAWVHRRGGWRDP